MSDQENLRGNVEDHIAEMLSHDQSKLEFAFMFTGYTTDSGDIESRLTVGSTSNGASLLYAVMKEHPDFLASMFSGFHDPDEKEED